MNTDNSEAMRLVEACKHGWLENVDPDKCSLEDLLTLLRQQAERIAELELQPAFAQLASDLAVKLAATEAERDQLRAEVERASNNRDMWKGQCERQAEQLEQLRAEVERLRVDAERLDWIEHQWLEDLVMGLAVDCEHDGQYYVCGDDNKTGYGDSLRAAIDHARTTHKDEG